MPNYLTISTFAKLTGLSPKALRLYEQEGLLMPEFTNPKTGYRYYIQAQAPVAERIRLLRSIDMPLRDIRSILIRQDYVTKQSLLQIHERRIEQQIGYYHEALQVLKELRTREIEAYPVAIKTTAKQWVVFIRQQSPLALIEVVRERAFGELYGFLSQAGIVPAGPGFSTNASEGKFEVQDELDWETDWHIDVCVPVTQPVENSRIRSRALPESKVAYALHTGPYEPLFQVYQKISRWLEQQNLTYTGQTREIYHLSLADTQRRNDLKTEVQFCLP
ncbi:MAG: GyrI-like domain-containing protein [Trueperaceae bacterium]|nr:GyrI-like domain-containing protein [Trueperaceae bacterium]